MSPAGKDPSQSAPTVTDSHRGLLDFQLSSQELTRRQKRSVSSWQGSIPIHAHRWLTTSSLSLLKLPPSEAGTSDLSRPERLLHWVHQKPASFKLPKKPLQQPWKSTSHHPQDGAERDVPSLLERGSLWLSTTCGWEVELATKTSRILLLLKNIKQAIGREASWLWTQDLTHFPTSLERTTESRGDRSRRTVLLSASPACTGSSITHRGAKAGDFQVQLRSWGRSTTARCLLAGRNLERTTVATFIRFLLEETVEAKLTP
uniref:Uncharacterized protein n=1 Tax=Sphaerodactylus townsendi TaxID=933632 RepID=A0ACB8FFA1_9SAUR